MTPPVAPKITAAPVLVPRGLSKASSGRSPGWMLSLRNSRSISRVVSTASTSGSPQASRMVGSAHSLFFAMQGMMDTTNIRWGSMPIFSAKYVFATAPNICWGDFAVDRQST